MDKATHLVVAKELLAARRAREPIDPVSRTRPGLTVEDAYAVQLEQVRTWTEDGQRVQGHKVGLTSAAMQRQLGVDQPDYGHLMESMFHLEGLPIGLAEFISPKVEPEIAFVLKRPLTGPGVNAAQALSAVDYVLPALEIIDSRIRDWKIGLIDTVADNASAGGVVLGSRPVPVGAVDLRLSGCVLTRRGEVVGTGAGGAVLGSPLNALVWLANTVGRLGVTLEPGHVILPGSVCAAVPVAAGDSVTAAFGGLGTVTARFGHTTKQGEDG
ncbi:2-keto-4-pentenoate hydratase [Streptomyces sporangiiformans]|uniref:2-keto-4-pentenoate hydratase n=1 Tax=Streptomyces sporangiiformans TaxID=2315329 RepID=A0A505DER6_9ACTN|nr:fumarylacetoacetate hydrolase family protein [Streptomyces sporangiiformans]TPQ21357.1 2-keto-4-pentenoate hydratase [Streptomyces sporangiiformans]